MNVKDIVSRYMQSRSGQDHIVFDDLTEVGAEDVESMGVPVESPDTFNGVLFRVTEEVQDGTHSGDVYVIYDELNGEGGILIMDRDGGSDESLGADASEEEIFSAIDVVVEKVLNQGDVYTHGQARDDFREESKMNIADRMIQEVLQGRTAESVTTSYFYYPPVTQTKRRKKKARIIEPLIGKGTSKKERTEMKRISLVETSNQRTVGRRPVREQDDESGWLGKIYLVVDGNQGIYMPQQFAQLYDSGVEEAIGQDGLDVLVAGPPDSVFGEGDESYWDVWEDCVLSFELKDQDGHTWTIQESHEGIYLVRDDFPGEDF